MSKTISDVRFLKYDKMGFPVFIANLEDDSFRPMADLHERCRDKFNDCRSPFYHNEPREYITMKAIKHTRGDFRENSVYDLNICFKRKNDYINVFINDSRLVRSQDHGRDVDLD